MARSDWALLLVSLTVVSALNVQFQENDMTVKEGRSHLKAVVTLEHNTEANITIQVIPRTLNQYLASGQLLPPDVNFATDDPAEEGLDFDGSPHTLFLGGGARQMQVVDIPIMEDNLTEREEVFLLELRIIRVDPVENVHSNRNVTVIRITPSDSDHTTIKLVAEKTHFHESNGTIANAMYIELDREIEANITVQLSQVTIGVFGGVTQMPKDLVLPKFVMIPSKTHKVYVPFEIVDDDITEGDQKVAISLVRKLQNLYEVDSAAVMFTIEDNDVARIGFSWNGTATDSLEMVEGEVQEFCVALLQPQATENFFQLSLSVTPSLQDTGVTLRPPQLIAYLLPQNSAHCFSMSTHNDEEINELKSIRFQIVLMSKEEIILDPSTLNIAIRDNDGYPMKPEITNLQRKNSNLHISWTVEVNKYKPVDKFIVSVTENKPLSSIVSRRQTNQLYEEHETNATSYIIAMKDVSSYVIKVCALNRNLRNCSKDMIFPVESSSVTNHFSFTESEKHNFPNDITPLPLVNREKQSHGGLGRTSFIAVIAGPAVAFALSLMLILTVLFCKCWGERRQYYPSKQEKIVMASNIEMKNFYYRQRSSTSSVSTNWTLASPGSNFTPSPMEAKPKILTLGTPV